MKKSKFATLNEAIVCKYSGKKYIASCMKVLCVLLAAALVAVDYLDNSGTLSLGVASMVNGLVGGTVALAYAAVAVAGIVAGGTFAFGSYTYQGIALIGAGLVCAGLSILLLYGCKAATDGTLLFTKKSVIWLKNRFAKKEVAQ